MEVLPHGNPKRFQEGTILRVIVQTVPYASCSIGIKVLWPEAVLQIGIWSESLCACNEHEYESTQWTYHSGIVERGHSDICMSLPCPYTVVVALQVASSIGEAKELHGQIS